jgi:hypothetical protein
MKFISITSLLAASALSLNVAAIQLDIKPGLWEHKFKFSEDSAGSINKEQMEQMNKAMEEMKKQMENLPPEQKKMMEQMMEKQGIKVTDKGIDMASQGVHISKDGTSVKVCLTQEDIDQGGIPQNDENCDQKLTQVSAKSYKITFECKGEHPSKGEGQVTFQSDKAYTGNMTVTTQVGDKTQVVKGDQAGKWLGSDCGNIKSQSEKMKELKALQAK